MEDGRQAVGTSRGTGLQGHICFRHQGQKETVGITPALCYVLSFGPTQASAVVRRPLQSTAHTFPSFPVSLHFTTSCKTCLKNSTGPAAPWGRLILAPNTVGILIRCMFVNLFAECLSAFYTEVQGEKDYSSFAQHRNSST